MELKYDGKKLFGIRFCEPASVHPDKVGGISVNADDVASGIGEEVGMIGKLLEYRHWVQP